MVGWDRISLLPENEMRQALTGQLVLGRWLINYFRLSVIFDTNVSSKTPLITTLYQNIVSYYAAVAYRSMWKFGIYLVWYPQCFSASKLRDIVQTRHKYNLSRLKCSPNRSIVKRLRVNVIVKKSMWNKMEFCNSLRKNYTLEIL